MTGVSAEAECQAACSDTVDCSYYTWYDMSSPLLSHTCYLFSSCVDKLSQCQGCSTGQLDCLPRCDSVPTPPHGHWVCYGEQSDRNECHLECDSGYAPTSGTRSTRRV